MPHLCLPRTGKNRHLKTEENCPLADWLGYSTSAQNCRMAGSDTSASFLADPAKPKRVERAPGVGCPQRWISECGHKADYLTPTMERVDLYSRPAPSPKSRVTFATTGYMTLGFLDVFSAERPLGEGRGKRTKRKIYRPILPLMNVLRIISFNIMLWEHFSPCRLLRRSPTIHP